MTTIKSHTDLIQSKKLADILPIESADMFYRDNGIDVKLMWEHIAQKVEHPCWSFAALFDVLPDGTDVTKDKSDTANEKYMCTVLVKDSLVTTFANNPVDVCVEMILKLHKLKLM